MTSELQSIVGMRGPCCEGLVSRILGHKGGRDDTLEGTGVLEIYSLGVSGSGFPDFGSRGDPRTAMSGRKSR